MNYDVFYDKAFGAFAGLILGDAVGMPVEFLPPEMIKKEYGKISTLVSVKDFHPHKGLKFGSITDDSEQALYLAEEMIKDKMLTYETVKKSLLRWVEEKDVFNKSYLGPSSKKALIKLKNGEDYLKTGNEGNTIGAAMRVVPVGIVSAGNVKKAIDDAVISSYPTHSVSKAIAGATSLAAAISECFNPRATPKKIIDAAICGAKIGQTKGLQYCSSSVWQRIVYAINLIEEVKSTKKVAELLYNIIGTDMFSEQIIPVIFSLFYKYSQEFPKGLWISVNLGGDSDTIAGLLGSVYGAFYGINGFPSKEKVLFNKISEINNLQVGKIVEGLWKIRQI